MFRSMYFSPLATRLPFMAKATLVLLQKLSFNDGAYLTRDES